MDFWNIAIPAFTFLAPVAAGLFFILRGRPEAENTWGMATFGMVMLISLVALGKFAEPIRLEFLWPFSAEPSGYFEFTLQLQWTRYVWIFFSNGILFAFSAFDGATSLRGQERSLKFGLLAGVSFISSLAYLSENVLLSLMFIEVMVFLLYAFGLQSGSARVEQEKISYFKRSSFLFLALISLFAMAATGRFSTNSVMLLGLVLYILALIFSRHTFGEWGQLSFTLLQSAAIFFLLGRIVREDMSPELWLPISSIFAVAAALFGWFSLSAVSALGSSFWFLFSVMGYLLYLRFISGRPEDPFWGVYEAIALGSVFAVSTLFRFGRQANQGFKKWSAFGITTLLLAVFSGAIPGVDIVGARASLETPIKLVLLGALTFLLSMVAGKSLIVSFSKENPKSDTKLSFVSAMMPGLALILLQIGAVVRVTDLYGEGPFRMGAAYLLTNPHITTMGAAVFLGVFAGLLLGSNASFVKWIKNKEKTMEDFFPGIDPVIVSWNEKTFRTPELGMDWLSRRLAGLSARAASFIQAADRSVFGDKLYQNLREYGTSLSLLTRYFHSGSIRAYMFLGIIVTLLASVIFLLEGK